MTFIYVSDQSKECSEAGKLAQSELPDGWKFIHRKIDIDSDKAGERYKTNSQLLIASLQGEAFSIARKIGASQVWNVEADILVRPDTLQVLEWSLAMPQGDGTPYYDIAMAAYWNGHFLGGHGDYAHPIAEDFLPEERVIPDELKAKFDAHKKEESEFISEKKIPPSEWQEKGRLIMEEIRKCPPDGNIFELLSKHGWRRRGWLDQAWPGIGKGALLPSDWIGTGCVLLSKKALALANFDGYNGQGTQDLYLCWRRWHPAGLRHCVSTHTLCDHIKHEIIDGKHTGKYIHYEAVHEEVGEMRGHLRIISKPWIPL